MNKSVCSGLMALTLVGSLIAPLTVSAQDHNRRDNQDYQDNRDRHDNQDNRDRRDNRDNRDYRDNRDNRDYRDRRDSRYENRGWDDIQRRDWLSHHRQETKNEWRNIAIGAGAVGVLGLIEHDPTLSILGGAGALYSLNRYEQDRRSQSREDRLRAEYFSHPYFYRDGVRYDRHTVTRNGRRYYQFERH
jgi:Ni/Co efflux regulator RcnB